MGVASGPRRRSLVVLALGLVPWTVVVTGGGGSSSLVLVFPVGMVTVTPPHLTTVYDYLFRYTSGLPGHLRAWPASVLLYLAALASAAVGLAGREDRRLTGGLLVLAALAHLPVALGLSRATGRTAYPVGALLALAAAWWCYRGDLRRLVWLGE